jgi:hypothetical protein
VSAADLILLLGPAVFVVGIALVARSAILRSRNPDPLARVELERRYRAGEISYAEYRQRRARLS